MIIETKFGKFKILKNYREAFDKELFEAKYFSEIYDRFDYIVGDISSEKLRLKGFTKQKNDPKFYRNIPIYLAESCNMNTAYFILERVNE